MLDIVGPSEIAAMLRVHKQQITTWQRNGVMPPPEAMLRRGPVWRRATITEWAELTGRAVSDASD